MIYYIHKETGQAYRVHRYEPDTSQVILTWGKRDVYLTSSELKQDYIKVSLETFTKSTCK